MKYFLTTLFLICAVGIPVAQTTSSVTFRVNMGPAAARGLLDVSRGDAYLSGSMNGWNGSSIPMERDNSTTDTVYSITLSDMIVDSVYEYKFLAGGNWELIGDNDENHRMYQVKPDSADNILPVAYFSDDSTYPEFSAKEITVHFNCNMELDIAKGAFDPSVDELSVRAGFNGWSAGISTLKKPLSGTIFSFDTTFVMIPGHTFEYVYTYVHNGGTTWEGKNSVFTLTEDEYNAGEDIELRYFNGADTISTTTGFSLYFQTDVSNAQADIGGVLTPFPNGVKRIAVVGGEHPLAWPAIGWPDADTTKVKWMNDSGVDGDLTAGDNIWTLKIDFSVGSLLRIPYKYSINYGMPEDNAGSNDNEIYLPTGDANHWVTIPSSTITSLRTNDVWGTIGETVVTGTGKTKAPIVYKFSLEQNYPNPFNPSTTIKYTVPEAGLVTLKVYNLLGQEVAVLVNEVKAPSENVVNFDASGLSSGLYFYQLNMKNYNATKKMMLVK
ncbi:MAG: T9SS type A sorting domain-containing protein [Ignavibacteria bacterium]